MLKAGLWPARIYMCMKKEAKRRLLLTLPELCCTCSPCACSEGKDGLGDLGLTLQNGWRAAERRLCYDPTPASWTQREGLCAGVFPVYNERSRRHSALQIPAREYVTQCPTPA